MVEKQTIRGWLYKNRKPLAVIILLLIIPQIAISAINLVYNQYMRDNPELDPMYEPSYNLTVWIAPEDEEFALHLDFYSSEQDAYSKTNRYEGHGFTVEPLNDDEYFGPMYMIPENIVSIWVKLYFNEETEEPFIILRVELLQKITTSLLSREISILVEPLYGESR